MTPAKSPSDAEVNRRLAEKTGWTELEQTERFLIGISPTDKPILPSTRKMICPNWCSDLSAAWKLAEERFPGEVLMLTRHRTGYSFTHCPFDATFEEDAGGEADADSPASALARAVLAALEGRGK